MKVINNLRVPASRCGLSAGVTPRAPGRGRNRPAASGLGARRAGRRA